MSTSVPDCQREYSDRAGGLSRPASFEERRLGTNRPVEGLAARGVFKWYRHVSEIVPMLQLVIVLSLTLGVLAAATWLGVARLEAAHPPTGQFVEVRGVRGCMLSRSASRATPPAPTLPSC